MKAAPKKPKKKSPSRPSTKGQPEPPINSGPFWLARSTAGRKPIFPDPETLWNACLEYFAWINNNPIVEEKIFCNQGEIVRGTVKHIHAMTIAGLCIFLDIDRSTWDDYREKPGFSLVCTRAEETMRHQKFSGAAADLLNPAIIARDLGLVDKQEQGGQLTVVIKKFSE